MRYWTSGSSGGRVGISFPSLPASGPRKSIPVSAEKPQPASEKITKKWP